VSVSALAIAASPAATTLPKGCVSSPPIAESEPTGVVTNPVDGLNVPVSSWPARDRGPAAVAGTASPANLAAIATATAAVLPRPCTWRIERSHLREHVHRRC
jgi:hypothetical protein